MDKSIKGFAKGALAQTFQPTGITPTVTFQNPETDGDDSWFERAKRCKPTSNSIGTVALVFLSGGMFMAWSFSFGFTLHTKHNTEHMICSWFIGAIIGAFCGAIVTKVITKKLLVLFSSVLVIVSGILAASLPSNYDAIISARYLNGIANGISLVVCLVMAGEESVNILRGLFASSTEVMCFSLGVYLQIVLAVSWPSDSQQITTESSFDVNQLSAILSIFYGVLGLILAFFLVIETPVFYLVRNEEQKALDSLRRLERPFVITQETYLQLEELKSYIAENKQMSLSQSIVSSLSALFKLCFYRGMNALSSSIIVIGTVINASGLSKHTIVVPFILYGTFRYIGTLISALCMDSIGRKKPLLFSMLICAGMAFGIAGIFTSVNKSSLDPANMNAALGLLYVYQFFAGVYSASSSVYLSEAFPLAVKTYNIAIAFIVEMLIHIIICVSKVHQHSISNYFYTVGSLSIVFFVFTIFFLPETKNTTLRQAQAKFKPILSKGF